MAMYRQCGERQMTRMIRKQVYLGDEQEKKLRRLASRWGCAEAEVLRTAIDRLPDPEHSVEGRLREAGLLVRIPVEPDLPQEKETLAELERDVEAWLASRPKILNLSQAVLEDRR